MAGSSAANVWIRAGGLHNEPAGRAAARWRRILRGEELAGQATTCLSSVLRPRRALGLRTRKSAALVDLPSKGHGGKKVDEH